MCYLLVVAHPDDEVLGAGATMYKLSKKVKMLTCVSFLEKRWQGLIDLQMLNFFQTVNEVWILWALTRFLWATFPILR